MTDQHECTWRLAPSEIRLHTFDDTSSILFHCGSGDTHVLDEFGCVMVEALQKGALAESMLFKSVAESLHYELDKAFEEHLTEVVSTLHKMDIIQQT